MDWDDIRYFARLAELGSLAATARSFGVNHATVARHIARLERQLGTTLFDRRAEGYVPTVEGLQLIGDARAMASSADAILDRMRGRGLVSGPVRLTAVTMLAEQVLIPGLAALRSRHPGIDLELIMDGRVLSLARREADIAIRLGHPQDSDLVCRRLCDLAYAFYATPQWQERIDAGDAPHFVGFDAERAAAIAEAQWLAERYPDARFPFRVNGHAAQAAAARAGFGIALLPRFLGDREDMLGVVDLGALPADRPIWLVTRPDIARQERFRAVIDAITPLFRSL